MPTQNEISKYTDLLLRDGYFCLPGAIDSESIDGLKHDLSLLRSRLNGSAQIRPGGRITFVHEALSRALDALLAPQLTSVLEAIMPDTPVLFQAASYDRGSEYMAHTDRYFYHTNSLESEITVWIALEDVHPEAGPFFCVPGSHRWDLITPEYLEQRHPEWFGSARSAIQAGQWPQVRRKMLHQVMQLMAGAMEEAISEKLATRTPILLRKGEAVVWNSALVHGGMPRRDPSLARPCLVGCYVGKHSTAGTVDQYFLPKELGALARHPKLLTHGAGFYVLEGTAALEAAEDGP